MTAVAAGLGSVPMVFDYNLVLLFNDIFVTAGEPLPTLTWAVASSVVASLYESKYVCMYVCLRRRARGEGPGDLAGGGRLRVELDGAAAGHHLLRAALHAVRQIAAAEPGYIYLSMYVCM